MGSDPSNRNSFVVGHDTTGALKSLPVSVRYPRVDPGSCERRFWVRLSRKMNVRLVRHHDSGSSYTRMRESTRTALVPLGAAWLRQVRAPCW